jgi:hypothetical protein
LGNNKISTIASGAFSGLTALQMLYGAGLWAGGLICLLLWDVCGRAWICLGEGIASGLLCTASVDSSYAGYYFFGHFISCPFLALTFTCAHTLYCSPFFC